MIVVKVEADITAFERKLSAIEREQMPFATALALTKTAQFAKDQLREEMTRVFDAPTPFTLNSLYVRPASKTALIARVMIKDDAGKGNPATRWLLPEIQGGSRNVKRFESLLIRAGLMPGGFFAVPTSAAPFDQYGNVPGSTITKILSQLQASRDSLDNENATQRLIRNRRRDYGRYFVVRVDRPSRNPTLKPGIYERLGTTRLSSVVPIFIFTSSAPAYAKRYDFYGYGEKVARARFPYEMRTAMAQAMATAR